MAQLTADKQHIIESTDEILEYVVDDSVIVYEGAAVGLNSSTKKARQLVAGDLFLGHNLFRVNTNTGSVLALGNAARPTAKVRVSEYGVVVAVTGASDAGDIGKPVYASDSDTYTLTATSNSYVGKIVRYDAARDKFVVAVDRRGIGGIVALLTTSVGTANDTVPDVGAAFSQSTLNNIVATLAGKINAIAAVIR